MANVCKHDLICVIQKTKANPWLVFSQKRTCPKYTRVLVTKGMIRTWGERYSVDFLIPWDGLEF